MKSALYLCKAPLFLPCDNEPIQTLDLDSQEVTFPVSLTLLELLNSFNPKDNSMQSINSLVESIVKSTSFYFPDIPLIFERNGLSIFVEDDNQYHKLNWSAVILQFHISLLLKLGLSAITSTLRYSKKSTIIDPMPNTQNILVELHRRNTETRHDFGTGSIAFRHQRGCIGSFRNRSSSVGPTYESVSLVPPLEREENLIASMMLKGINQNQPLEINQLFNFQLNCSFETSRLFRSIILAISSKGALDVSLGNVIVKELEKELKAAGVQLPTNLVDSSDLMDAYLVDLNRCLLSASDEMEISSNLAQDRVNFALEKIESVRPFILVPHSASFFEQILAPLCYHENTLASGKAIELYSELLNGHSWELAKTEVTTADVPLKFDTKNGQIVLIAVTKKDGVYITTLDGQSKSFKTVSAGFYDYCYARLSENGEFEIDQSVPAGRFIVLPSGARKEVIHEMSAFDDKKAVPFERLESQLKQLSSSGVTAIHLAGAVERTILHRLTSVTDHTAICKACGGLEDFAQFCRSSKKFGLRVLIDFLPHVSMHNWSRKYTPFQTLKVDEDGVYKTAKIPGSENMLLNLRNPKLWTMIANEMIEICEKSGVSGFYLGDVDDWDYVYPRDMHELLRNDPDGQRHYYERNIIEGSVVIESQKTSKCGITTHSTRFSPFFMKMMRTLWSNRPDAFVWMKSDNELQRFVIESGLIPQNNGLTNVMLQTIDVCMRTDDLQQITASSNFYNFFKKRQETLQNGSLIITTFGSLTDRQYDMSLEAFSLVIDVLFFLNDVPLINGCLESPVSIPAAYEISTMTHLKQKPKKWNNLPAQKFSDLLKVRAATRARADWILSGNLNILPVAYDSNKLDAVLAISRQISNDHCAIICVGFYTDSLIFEVSVKDLPIFNGLDPQTIIQLKPLLGPQDQDSFYALDEITKEGSSLFLDIDKFSTNVFEISMIKPPVPTAVNRILMENIYTRLKRAIEFNSISILSHNRIFKSILNVVESDENGEVQDKEIAELIQSLPSDEKLSMTFRESLFLATRYGRENGILRKFNDDTETDKIEKREVKVLNLLERMTQNNLEFISKFASNVIEANKLGPIMFTAPELGPFSKVGGLSTMVWELAKELVSLGLDIHVVSPYYSVSPKGETNYLNKYNISYKFKMDVFCPNKTEIGVHYGVVDGVKCWFLHHYSYFSAPYQTGSTSFRLQLLVLMAKAPLELCCQARIIPSLIVTNDWMTGLTAAYGRKTFGSVFNGSRFLHIFHNLGVGYAGKLWPSDGNTSALHYIHLLPDEMIVDPFDHSIDPSLCALLATDQWATVSKKYRDELLEGSPYNYFLRAFPEPFAYSNGIRVKERLNAIEKLHMNHEQAKEFIQKKYFGEADPNKCVFIFVGRIVEQKGVYLIVDTFEELNKKFHGNLQFIVGGQAAADDREYGLPCTQKMRDLKKRYPKNFWADPSQFFADGLVGDHGSDYMLVPSLFEPSGIVQQEAFASGTPVIAFRTGGLADTIFEYDRNTQTGNGFLFWAHRHGDFVMAVERAYNLFLDKKQYAVLRSNAFKSVLSTEKVAREWAREFARLFMKIYQPNQNKSNGT